MKTYDFCVIFASMPDNTDHNLTVGFVALGCPKNIVDSEKMLALIGQAGFVLTGDPDTADVVVINTCGFIAPAKAEAIEAIRHAIKQKRKGKVRKVIVAGCLPQRIGQKLLREVPGIDTLIGLAQRDRIAQIIKETLQSSGRQAEYFAPHDPAVHDDRGRLLITPAHWAYLRISEGCSRRCSFCTIPQIRGSFRSKPPDQVLAEAAELVDNGAVELNIIAQDSTCYGRDMNMPHGLSRLIARLEQIDRLRWIRLMYLYPAGIDEMLIETIASSKKVLHYVDMPVQHINDRILRQMHRPDTMEGTYRLVEKLRCAMPDVVLRTTVIVGFPGETRQHFEQLLEFITWAGFDALGCFRFYPEEGTKAAELPDQVEEEIKHARYDEIMRTQQQIAFTRCNERIGTGVLCLIDEVGSDSRARGRFYGQAPHIDSVSFIPNCKAAPGEFIKVRIVARDGYDLIAEQNL
ncbi:MAG: 30S ribosomal protein S12 methylthiotransferase RimO [Planctomycetota bacterium]